MKFTVDGFNDLDDDPWCLPAGTAPKLGRCKRVDLNWLEEHAAIVEEAYDLTTETFREIADYFQRDHARHIYWLAFTAQFEAGQEIPPHRLRAFIAWWRAKQGAALRQKRHLRLVVDNTPAAEEPPNDRPRKPKIKRRRLRGAA
jgi:hypothetical protein